jgi:hypothetical protein
LGYGLVVCLPVGFEFFIVLQHCNSNEEGNGDRDEGGGQVTAMAMAKKKE